jgi:hypothetical protein
MHLVHHPVHDDIPGIDRLRDTFNVDNVVPYNEEEHGSFFSKPATAAVTHSNIDTPELAQVIFRPHGLKLGIATHEAAHLIRRVQNADEDIRSNPVTSHNSTFARDHIRAVRAVTVEGAANDLKDMYSKLGVPFRHSRDFEL